MASRPVPLTDLGSAPPRPPLLLLGATGTLAKLGPWGPSPSRGSLQARVQRSMLASCWPARISQSTSSPRSFSRPSSQPRPFPSSAPPSSDLSPALSPPHSAPPLTHAPPLRGPARSPQRPPAPACTWRAGSSRRPADGRRRYARAHAPGGTARASALDGRRTCSR